jgi:hypothetical protein
MLLVLPMPLTGGSYYPFHSVVAYAPLRRISILRKSDGIPDRNLLKSPAGVIFRVSCGVFPLQGIASGGRGLFGKPAFPLMGGKFFLGVEVAAASVAAKLVAGFESAPNAPSTGFAPGLTPNPGLDAASFSADECLPALLEVCKPSISVLASDICSSPVNGCLLRAVSSESGRFVLGRCGVLVFIEYFLHFGDPMANPALPCAALEFLRGEIGVNCERTCAAEDQSSNAGEIEQAGFIAGRTEAWARGGDGGEFNGTEAVR